MQNKVRIVFIVNPISGVGKQKGVEQKINDLLDISKFDHKIIYTQKDKRSDIIVKEQLDNFDVFVAIGGDGTINETAKYLINTDKVLGIIPAGSGNGFARHFNISIDIERSIKILNEYHLETIDTASINEHSFVAFAGTGFDAHVALLFSRGKKRGLWNYIKYTAKAFFTYKAEEYSIEIDNVHFKKKAFILVVANTNQYGNNAYIAPTAIANDGQLDICYIQKPSIFRSILFVYRLFNKQLTRSSYFETIKGKHVKITRINTPINLDGEPLFIEENIEIKINPLSLSLITPIKNG